MRGRDIHMAMENDKYHFKQNVYPLVIDNIKKNNLKLISYIGKYMDKNSEILLDTGIAKRLYFGGYDENIIYEILGRSDKDIYQDILITEQTNSSWILFNKPINWSFIMLAKYYYDNNKQQELERVLVYFTLSLYSSIHFRQFKFPPNENIMNYTINNLSNKFDIKRLGSFLRAVHKITMNSHEKYKDYLTDFSDRHIVEYIMNMRTRINNFVKELASQYYDNRDNKKYLNYEKDNNDTDNFHETDNISAVIVRLTETIGNAIVTNGVDERLVQGSSSYCNVSKNAIKDAIDLIIKKNNSEIHEMIRIILQQYLVIEKNKVETIASQRFTIFAQKLYTKSNVNDKDIIRLKKILDKWLIENCEKYVKTQRAATKNDYRRAIYFYFIFSIVKIYAKK